MRSLSGKILKLEKWENGAVIQSPFLAVHCYLTPNDAFAQRPGPHRETIVITTALTTPLL